MAVESSNLVTESAFVPMATVIRSRRFVNRTDDGEVGEIEENSTAGHEQCCGISRTASANTDEGPISIAKFNGGTGIVESGAAVAKGARITTDNQGRGIAATTGNHVYGKALTAAVGAGEEIEIDLTPEPAAA